MRLLALIPILFLASCATVGNPVPDDYKGPVAVLADTGMQEDSTKGQFFAALAVDGKEIRNALGDSRSVSYGRGFSLTSRYTTRNVPVQAMKIRLIGTHQTGAPIHEMMSRAMGTFFRVEGEVAFTPEEGRTYEVSGELKKERSCVWIQDAATRQPVTEPVCTT